MSGDNDIGLMETIEACRTCGVFFLTSSNYLRQIFSAAIEDADMVHIRMELSMWKIDITEGDGFPQYICTGCIHEFQKMFKFRRSCMEIQNQWRHFYTLRQQQQIQIKSELPDEDEEKVCDFIYVDDISDSEYDGTVAPFNITHIPMKEEIIEEAKIPAETPEARIDTANLNEQPQCLNQDQFCTQSDKIKNEEFDSNSTDSRDISQKDNTIAENTQLEENGNLAISKVGSHIKCEFCDCISLNKYEHKLHMKHIHEIKDLECRICGKTFKNSSSARLKFHLKWHKLSKHKKCAQCGFFCNSRNDLRDHTREMHSKVNCTICRKLVIPKKMEFHMRSHNPNMHYSCTHCAKEFVTLEEREQHRLHEHGDGVFDNTLSQGGHLENTNILESEVQNKFVFIDVVCAICEEKFSDQNDLQIHVEMEHRTNSKNTNDNRVPTSSSEASGDLAQIFCTICNERFNNQDALAIHLQMSQCANDINCSLNNGFSNMGLNQTSLFEQYDDSEKYTYEPHISKFETNEGIDASNIDMYKFINKCAQCSDTFENVAELQEHHDIMHQNKPINQCQICGKVFELKFSLNRHLKKHENVYC